MRNHRRNPTTVLLVTAAAAATIGLAPAGPAQALPPSTVVGTFSCSNGASFQGAQAFDPPGWLINAVGIADGHALPVRWIRFDDSVTMTVLPEGDVIGPLSSSGEFFPTGAQAPRPRNIDELVECTTTYREDFVALGADLIAAGVPLPEQYAADQVHYLGDITVTIWVTPNHLRS
jgi:hypothetical protein